ncbi:F-box protein CPR1-like [Papaver somniferum]|uniref:F-box protein CPR1-like n=1 Tax=Papaver somniferum TaxID=3469 RepID=UPI000E6FE7B2|nr:F-box protein CPR1-like [Papaver somniferum]
MFWFLAALPNINPKTPFELFLCTRTLQPPLAIILDGEKEETTPTLPDDIIGHILLMLPVKSIMRFRCVCKNWRYKLFRDPSFVNMHLKNSIQSGDFDCVSVKNHQDFNMLNRKSSQRVKYPNMWIDTHGSCNGLILMRGRLRNRWDMQDINLCLWNPTTKEFKDIEFDSEVKYGPAYSQDLTVTLTKVTYGLGYNCDTDDYKIVKVSAVYGFDSSRTYNRRPCYGSEVQVYALGSDSWKTLPNIVPYDIVYSCTRAFVNGVLYWIATPCPCLIIQKCNLILSFDIKSENFREVPLTPQVDELFGFNYPRRRMTLSVLGGCLCVVFLGCDDSEVWVMKDHKVRESWTNLFVAQISVEDPIACCMTLQCKLKGGEVLFTVKFGDAATYFVAYDPVHHKSELSKICRISGNNCSISENKCSIETFVESLV